MYSNVLDALLTIAPILSRDLVPQRALANMLAFAARHPELGQSQYIECRLGDCERSQVDLLVSAATSFERPALGRALAVREADDPELIYLQRFLARWLSADSLLHSAVPLTWLEFDHMEVEGRSVGNVCVCLAPAYLDPFAMLPELPAAAVLAVITESIRASLNREPEPEEQALFDRCLGALPQGARWIHFSIMAGRTPSQLKLYGVFPPGTALDYLREVGWAGDRSAVAELFDRYCAVDRIGGQLYLDLSVTGMLDHRSATLGINFCQQHLKVSAERDPGRGRLLGVLEDDGLCTSKDRMALIAWPSEGAADRHTAGQSTMVSVAGAVHSQRWLDVKLVYRSTAPLIAKAYLGFLGSQPTGRAFIRPKVGRPLPTAYPVPHDVPETI